MSIPKQHLMKTILHFKIACLMACLVIPGSNYTQAANTDVMQDKDQNNLWVQVDSLKEASMPKAALAIVEQIQRQALAEKNQAEYVKTILYQIRLSSDFEEDHLEKSIALVDDAIAKADMPSQAVLHSIQAELYFRYFDFNRYLILDRTMLEVKTSGDIKTWDAYAIISKAAYHYQQSLAYPDELKKTPAGYFSSILDEKEESKIFRPTLFDLLAHRALDFFMSPQASIIQPRDPVQLNQEWLFAEAKVFANEVLPEPASLSFNYNALEIFRQLLGFHIQAGRIQALVDADLRRLAWLRNNCTLSQTDNLFMQALENLEAAYSETEAYPDIAIAIAYELVRIGNTWNPFTNTEPRLKLKEAVLKLESVIERFPDLPATKNCRNLLQQIKEPSLQLQGDYVNLPGKPFKMLVSHKNVKEIYIRLIRLNPETDRELKATHQNANDLISAYLKMPPFRSWKQDLPDDGDFQSHNTEIPFQALPLGYYVLVAGFDNLFEAGPHTLPFTSFWCSALSYTSRRSTDGSMEFLVLDRENGKPLSNVKATTYQRQYNPNTRQHDLIKGPEYTTSRNGTFTIPAPGKRSPANNIAIDFTYKSDRLFTENFFSQQRFEQDKRIRTQTYFFSDRSLYRPGQVVYFKGIVIETDGENHKIKPGTQTTVILYDANRRKISEVTLTTNEFGSFAGNFVLPTGLLTGMFQISNENGNIGFSVEEYKLPRFEVRFDTLKGSYKIGETVTVQGQALAYAGNPISNAELTFRVTRQARFPFRDYMFRHFFHSGPPTEILNGTLTTDAEGRFEITFLAEPDLSIPKTNKPAFIFSISADVTDIQGETQSGSTSVGIGYVALTLQTDLPANLNRDKFDGFRVKATNMNGVEQAVTGDVLINRLKQSGKIYRERKYARPDRFVMDKSVHDKMFPFDEYDNESDPEYWSVDRQMFIGKFNTGNTEKLLPSDFNSWEPGVYLIELKSQDEFGEAVEYKMNFTLYSPANKKPPVKQIWWSQVISPTVEPGQQAQIMIGSAIRLNVLYEIEIKGEIVKSERIRLNRRTRLIEIPVNEAHIGGFRVLFTSTAHNRAYAEAFTINVPDRSKELKIELATLRNKLEPGGKEEWKFILRDHKGNPLTAELLAGMYDASLDALRPHNWAFNLYQVFPRSFNWEVSDAFNLTSAYASFFRTWLEPYIRKYDQLNWFGFEFYGFRYMDFRSGAMRSAKQDMMLQAAEPEATGAPMAEGDIPQEIPEPAQPFKPVQTVRRDFRETAFFYPQMHSNENGEISISFTVPESLTRWRLMGLAHATDLKQGFLEKLFESSRDVMVVPNPPRFFRHGDRMDFRSKVVNTTGSTIEASVKLEFFDALTMNPVNELFGLGPDMQKLSVTANNSQDVSWEINVPETGPYAVIYRVTAFAGSQSDGEENMLPVLTNRQLLTEGMPMFAGADENRTFNLNKLLQSGQPGATAQHHQLTLEFTSNPVWYAVQALPYLSEPSYPSAESYFNQFYSNRLAKYIIDHNPEIERVFEIWRTNDPAALQSNLEKNQDLKSVVLEETPWVNDAMGESERKRQIALLFDRNQIDASLDKSLKSLLDMQMSNGGWPWMPGMRDSRHVTQQLIAGFGRLKSIGAMQLENNPDMIRRMQQAVQYLDERMTEEYNDLKKPVDSKQNYLNAGAIQYLWARSYWIDLFPVTPKHQEGFAFWKNQAEKNWTSQNLYLQGMIALALHRIGNSSIPPQIMRSINDRSLSNPEFGMYWRDLRQGFYWYQAPVETQALLIEAYATISKDMASVEKMQQWLITQKRTQAWKSNRATAEAIYAILMRGKQSLAPNTELSIQIGNHVVKPASDPAIREEAGSGYFRISWNRNEISPDMGKIIVSNPGKSIAWGGLYWQYFERLDRITPHETPLKLNRSIMRQILTPSGVMLEEVTAAKPLAIGDKMIMRIELRVDRDLEYVHMKDLRAPAFEPIEQLSGYKYQGGLGYYESPGDVATHFYFQYLPRGTWVFEYPVVVAQSGDFSSGITTIQCLYAPEFTAHSEGTRVIIE